MSESAQILLLMVVMYLIGVFVGVSVGA